MLDLKGFLRSTPPLTPLMVGPASSRAGRPNQKYDIFVVGPACSQAGRPAHERAYFVVGPEHICSGPTASFAARESAGPTVSSSVE
jgi:hypothetical protein